jgi:hypothetical protein
MNENINRIKNLRPSRDRKGPVLGDWDAKAGSMGHGELDGDGESEDQRDGCRA